MARVAGGAFGWWFLYRGYSLIMGLFSPGWPFPGCRGTCGLCVRSRARHARASSSEVCPAGKLQ